MIFIIITLKSKLYLVFILILKDLLLKKESLGIKLINFLNEINAVDFLL